MCPRSQSNASEAVTHSRGVTPVGHAPGQERVDADPGGVLGSPAASLRRACGEPAACASLRGAWRAAPLGST
jgi:hypothetical protein